MTARTAIGIHAKKTLADRSARVSDKNLAVSYFRMEEPHTIIGAEQFHFRVRNGIGWFLPAMAARKTVEKRGRSPLLEFGKLSSACTSQHLLTDHTNHLGVIWSSLTGN